MNASFAALVFSWAFTAIFVPTEAQPTLPPSPPPAPNAMDSATSPPPGSTKHPSPPPPQPPISLSQLERRFPAPPLEKLYRAALSRSALQLSHLRRWRRRSRIAGALPTVSSSYDVGLDQGWELDQEAGTPNEFGRDLDLDHRVGVKASWQLDRLFFDPDELRAAQTGFDLWEQHQRLLLEITQLYFEHRRCALESMSTPNDALAELERALLRREIEGKLLALTGIEWPSAPP